MASKRDQLFPSTSLSRTHTTHLTRTPSHESLTAHPLLSPKTSPPPPSDQGGGGGSPRYVPYTPRQRVAATSATTGTTVHPPSPQQHQGDATTKLQLMNLKAAAQNTGLDTNSVGWAILEKLVSESGQNTEWVEIWSAITSGKATLLLPLEQASSHEKLTVDFIRDHIVLCDGLSRKNTQIITLSGLRGVLNNETLTFRSTLHPSSKVFQDLLIPSIRSSLLTSIPPLPNPLGHPYPTFTLPSDTSSLPLPQHPPAAAKPPLPPRPRAPSATSPSIGTPLVSTPASASSRLSNPFASLFGTTQRATPASTPPLLVHPSPPASLHSVETPDPVGAVDVAAFTIDRRVVRRDVGREMTKALKGEIKDALSQAPNVVPGWVVDRVHDFTAGLYPIVKITPTPAVRARGIEREGSGGVYVVNARFEEGVEGVAEQFQDFYSELENELNRGGGKRDGEDGIGEGEIRVREIMDIVERVVCSLFYDRLFKQSTSDDASHDEALSSRVAALNMLDLGLEHLDVHVGDAGAEVDLVVQACGDMLSQLEKCRTPGDKAAILVAAHKIVVDGLSRLPPIRLKSEEEVKAQKSKEGSGPLPKLATDAEETAAEGMEIPFTASPPATPVLHATPPSPRPSSPAILTVPHVMSTTPVSGDILLPLIIFSVVKANPPHLVSNLLYTQRFRNQAVGGEESYCLINLMAVAEFLENVDLAALGLGDGKVVSTADLTPIPLTRNAIPAITPLSTMDGIPGSLRGRMEQQVDAIAGSANKVITGVVDSSFGILRSFLPNNADSNVNNPTGPDVDAAAKGTGSGPGRGFGLLRRESVFSISGIAAALPIGGRSGTGNGEETGQQLLVVSRPGSVRSSIKVRVRDEDGSGEEGDTGDDGSGSGSGGDSESEEGGSGEEEEEEGGVGDARSIRSFESMMSGKSGKRDRMGSSARKSLSDRLAHMSSLAGLKGSPPTSRRTSLLPQASSGSSANLRLPPPVQRFVECAADDLRLSEVGELLREYKRLVEGIRAVGGFDE